MKMPASSSRSIAPIIVGAAAIAICAAGITFLAFALINTMQGPTWKDNANQPVHVVPQEKYGSAWDDETRPLWLADTRGIDLPEDCIPSDEALMETASIAQNVFDVTPLSRAYAVLRTDYHVDTYFFDTLGDLFWDVTMETSDGIVEAWINAYTGESVQAEIVSLNVYSSDPWAFFDEWAESGSESEPSGLFGSISEERQWAAEEDMPQSAYQTSSKEHSLIRREQAAALAEDPALAPYAECALQIVTDSGLADGAEAVSATVVLEGIGSYSVDVELSNGSHLALQLMKDDPSIVKFFERHRASLLNLFYPL